MFVPPWRSISNDQIRLIGEKLAITKTSIQIEAAGFIHPMLNRGSDLYQHLVTGPAAAFPEQAFVGVNAVDQPCTTR
jgi:hypothetical protein